MNNEPPIAPIAMRIADGTATDADRDQARALITESDENLQFYLAYMRVQAILVMCRESPQSTADLTAPLVPSCDDSITLHESVSRLRRRQATSHRIVPFAYAIAAAIALASAAIALYLFVINRNTTPPTPQSQVPIATLIESTSGGVLVNGDFARSGGEYAAGTYSMDSGSAELLLRSRVSVSLEGTSRLLIHDPMRVFVEQGLLQFVCPPEATGFTVHLPDGSRIIDLGTAFRVFVGEDRAAILRVTEGQVRWLGTGSSDKSELIGAGQAIRIAEGRALVAGEAELAIDSSPVGGIYDLDSYGLLDWAYWSLDPGIKSASSVPPAKRKRNINLIAAMSPVEGGSIRGSGKSTDQIRFRYIEDSSSSIAESEFLVGLFNSQLAIEGAGVQIPVTLPERKPYKVNAWATALHAGAAFEVQADDQVIIDRSFRANGERLGRLYTVMVTPAYAGQTILLRLTLAEGDGSSYSHVALAGVAVAEVSNENDVPKHTNLFHGDAK